MENAPNYNQLIKFVQWFTSGNSIPVDIKYLISRNGDKILAEAERLIHIEADDGII